MTRKSYQLLLSFGLSLVLAFAFMPLHTAHAQCDDGTSGNDILECDTDDPDDVRGRAGDDDITITIDGDVADLVSAGTGQDEVVNNGNVTNFIRGNDGNDDIHNEGTTDVVAGNDGNDFISNAGTANVLRGNAGNDVISVRRGSSDVVINGGDDIDELRFALRIGDEDEFDRANDIVNQLIANGTTSGTVTLDGITFTFNNIEELANVLDFAGGTDTRTVRIPDRRINREDISAPIAGFCSLSGGVEIWIINDNSGIGEIVLSAFRGQIGSALGLARATGQNQPVAFGSAGSSLWALSSGELQLVYRGDYNYNYIFSANYCGPISIRTVPVQQPPVQPQTVVPQQQVSVPQVVPQTQQTFPQVVTQPNTDPFDPATQTVSTVPQVPPAATTGSGQTHVVRAGENLFRISLRYGVSLNALAAANGIADVNTVYAGQVLTIP